eukprot:UN19992
MTCRRFGKMSTGRTRTFLLQNRFSSKLVELVDETIGVIWTHSKK